MYEDEFRREFAELNPPNVITQEWLDENIEADIVLEGPFATGGTVYQFSVRSGVEKIGDYWYTKYVLGPIFESVEEEEKYKARKDAEKAYDIRLHRNKRLSDCDWTQLSDAAVDKAVWAEYRQNLRDIPTQEGFPWNVVWPNKPE